MRISELPQEIRELLIKRAEEQHGNWSPQINDNIRRVKQRVATDSIDSAIYWSQTDEGHQYWQEWNNKRAL